MDWVWGARSTQPTIYIGQKGRILWGGVKGVADPVHLSVTILLDRFFAFWQTICAFQLSGQGWLSRLLRRYEPERIVETRWRWLSDEVHSRKPTHDTCSLTNSHRCQDSEVHRG